MKAPTIHLVGDSTMADYPLESHPQMGWGQKLSVYFKDEVTIINNAVNGRSSKSFLTEGRLQEITPSFSNGDFLFIQFGHNDNKSDLVRKTDPFTTFQENLRLYIETARSKGVTPILLSPIQRRKFLDLETLKHTHGQFPEAMREVAEVNSVMLIDLTIITTSFLLDLGYDRSKELFMHLAPGDSVNYPKGAQDDTHLNENGALLIAGSVAHSLFEMKSPLSPWICQ